MTEKILMEKLNTLAEEVLELEKELNSNKTIAEDFRKFLIWAGYDVKNYGSYYPLILFGVKNIINPN